MNIFSRKSMKSVRCLLALLLVAILAIGCTDAVPPKNPTTPNSPKETGQPLDASKQGKMTLTLYFATRDASHLVAEKREVPKNNHPAKTAMDELIVGPKNTTLEKVMPEATKVRDIKIKDHVAYVDFTEAFVKDHWGGSAGEILTISAVINTLTEFPEVKRVQFMVDGRPLETLKGHLDLSEPLQRNEAIIKK
jgi:spore germination protein GerM